MFEFERPALQKRLHDLWLDTDIFGLFLFTAGLVLVLLPMTLTVKFHNEWASPATISMIIIGGLCFIGFIVYELKVPQYPILSIHLAKSRTVAAGCLIESIVFLNFYLWQPYYYSFIVVVNNQSPKAATNIITAQSVSTAVVGMLAAFLVKFTGRCKWVIIAGSGVKLVGAGLMLRYSNTEASTTQILFSQIISGAGTGMISIVAQTAVQAVAKHQGTFGNLPCSL